MNILLINQHYHPDISATAQLCSDYAEGLVLLGHRVTVLCGNSPYRAPHRGRSPVPPQVFPPKQHHNGVDIVRVAVPEALPPTEPEVLRLGHRAWQYGVFLARAAKQLTELQRPQVIVVLTSPPFLFALGLWAKHKLGAKLVLWVQDLYPDLLFAMKVLPGQTLLGPPLARLTAPIYQQADAVIALDQAMAERLVLAGAKPSTLTVIDHCADVQNLVPGPRGNHRLRQDLNLPDGFLVCYAGNHGRGHDFDTLLGAICAQLESPGGPPIHWLFVGEGDEKARFWQRLPPAARAFVFSLPPQARGELSGLFAAADVGLISVRAQMEGLLCPSKLYGWLAAGRPIAYIGPARGRIAGLFDEMDLGVSVRNGDGAGLLSGLRSLAQDPARWTTLSATCRTLALTRFSPKVLLSKHEQLLTRVCRKTG